MSNEVVKRACKLFSKKKQSNGPKSGLNYQPKRIKTGGRVKFWALPANQLQFMDNLFTKLNLITMEDMLSLSKKTIVENGGKKLLYNCYNGNLIHLFTSLYPYYPWPFTSHLPSSVLSHRTSNIKENNLKEQERIKRYFMTEEEFHRERVQKLIRKYKINEKKDFYRASLHFDRFLNSIQITYPEEQWSLPSSSRKSNQRILFASLSSYFSQFFLIENYRHPLSLYSANSNHNINNTKIKEEEVIKEKMEFDIFIPEMNIAFEYQGEQHYSDFPFGFGYSESYFLRDQLKRKYAKENNIKLVIIPYWFDHSFFSLFSTMQSLSHLFIR